MTTSQTTHEIRHPLAEGFAPAWASAWGQDDHAPWAAVEVKGVEQRLRWLPPGRFQMGSPDDEPRRFDDEGPQHEVNLSTGFWMFETACTQELWEAVMGDNPSEFSSPTRPVEQVSWDDCQEFIGKLNKELSGIQFGLPREAQWEYACRAGTDTALYNGPIEIFGERNAPELDPITWYGGNSGIDFDLETGYGTSDWEETQYEFDVAGTHPVKKKQPNAWGLYDILGNVWEWCHDWYSDDYYNDSPSNDPLGPPSRALRVVRGGNWGSKARYVRCAFRYYHAPDGRSSDLGFRCVAFSPSLPVADGSGSEPSAEQG